ncbi:putative Late nodulin [Medicago truncatula]|uniref:Putative Late nodulin n=1 Tax=Medicago truncatula TaxID=3880 RepID=A0A396HFC6_MEDTR|nr:putative Late nodulin [Medicago truncatula]RHN51241.1 putative Late nodulin [Medicago truncatula]
MNLLTKNVFDMIIFLSPLIVTMSMKVLCGRDGTCPRFMCGPGIIPKCVGRYCEC